MPEVILVDENNNPVGSMEKMEAHKKGLLHRAFSIFIFNQKGQLLLQKRATGKYHCGGLWSNTCCSHPAPGENLLESASQRLMEEMGIETELREIFTFTYRVSFENGLTENEFDHVLIGFSDTKPKINPDEAEDWKYIDKEIALKATVDNPDEFTPWFKIALPKVISSLSEPEEK